MSFQDRENFKKYSIAAEQGDSNAQFMLACAYFVGKGTNKSYEKYQFWLACAYVKGAYDIDADGDNGINEKKCISPYGFFWGLTARAYYLKAYDVMALLAANGFDEFACYDKGWNDTWYADKHIWRTGDLKALRILLENGYVYDLASEKYILGRPQVRRKTIGLDPAKFHKSISPPKYEDEPLFFGRKEAKARNARRREDYEDRVRAHKEFQNSFGIDNLRELRTRWKSAKKEYDALLASVSISEKDISRIIFEMGAE